MVLVLITVFSVGVCIRKYYSLIIVILLFFFVFIHCCTLCCNAAKFVSVDRLSVCKTCLAWNTRQCWLEWWKSSEEPWHSMYPRPQWWVNLHLLLWFDALECCLVLTLSTVVHFNGMFCGLFGINVHICLQFISVCRLLMWQIDVPWLFYFWLIYTSLLSLDIFCHFRPLLHTISPCIFFFLICPVWALGAVVFVRIDLIHFLAGCRNRQLNHG